MVSNLIQKTLKPVSDMEVIKLTKVVVYEDNDYARKDEIGKLGPNRHWN